MAGNEAQRDWVGRVLGVTFGARGADRFATLWPAAKAGWQAAIEQVDGEISQLQAALRSSADGELNAIAEFGLNGVTGNHKVRLAVAIMEIDRASGAGRSGLAKKAASLIDGFRSHIADDVRISACDANPFGVTVGIRAAIGPALAKLAAALETA